MSNSWIFLIDAMCRILFQQRFREKKAGCIIKSQYISGSWCHKRNHCISSGDYFHFIPKLNCFDVDLLLPCSVEKMGLCKKKTLCCHNRLWLVYLNIHSVILFAVECLCSVFWVLWLYVPVYWEKELRFIHYYHNMAKSHFFSSLYRKTYYNLFQAT